jgi:hypothetical protein
MTDGRPTWRQAFDALERRAAGPLENAVATGAFADVLTLAVKVRGRVRTEMERQSRRVLHACNLPAASDIARLNRRIGALERHIVELDKDTPDGAGSPSV